MKENRECTILVVGSINMDLTIRTARVPVPGENVFGSDLRMAPGGKGANQAVGVARLGHRAVLAGRVGVDYFGETLLRNLQMQKVDVTNVVRDKQSATGIALILVDQKGENSIVIATGANGRFSSASAAGLKSLIESADLVLLQLELPLDPVARIIDIARALKKRVILDAGPPCYEARRSFFSVTVLSPNRVEAEALTGMSITDTDSAAHAARILLERGPQAIAMKLGEQGALLSTAGLQKFFPARDVRAVDTVGAGDAFSAALSVALAEGKGYEEAVEFANAAGAMAVTKSGAQDCLPTRAELDTYLSST